MTQGKNLASLALTLALLTLILRQLLPGLPVNGQISGVFSNAGSSLPAFILPAATYDKAILRQLTLFQPARSVVSTPTSSWQVVAFRRDDPRLRQAPLTQLPLRLVGLLSNDDCAGSVAIIEQDKHQDSYSCGEFLPGNRAEIVRIFTDRVVMSYQGNYQSLIMD